MPNPGTENTSSAGGASERLWPSTIWSLIRTGRDGSAEERKDARDRLCRLYYTPVLRFFQRALRVDPVHVEDLTQEFFTRFIEKEFLRNVAREKSFRGFLKVACRRHFIDWLRTRKFPALRVPLDEAIEATAAEVTPERIDAMIDEELGSWTLEEAVARLKEDLINQGKEIQFRIFEARTGLGGETPAAYADLAARFGVSVFDIGNHMAAARASLRRILLDLAADRSDDPGEELRELGLNKFLN